MNRLSASATAVVVCMGLAIAAPARADEFFTGAYQHAAELHISAGDEEGGVDAELGYRTEPMQRRILFGRPRVQFLLSRNLSGDTNFAALDLLWRHDYSERFYGQLGFGLAVHDGVVHRADLRGRTNRIAFGSRVLFEPELDFGWRLSPRLALEASYVHISNGHIWTKVNPGMDDVGVRLIYRVGGS